MLDRTHAALTEYVWFPAPEAADAHALWTAASHAQPAWRLATRSIAESLIHGSGKTTLLEVTLELTHNPLPTANISPAAIARSINPDDPPVILYDEIDTAYTVPSEFNQTLTGILNAGYSRKFPYGRWNWNAQKRDDYIVFAMACLACKGTGVLPEALISRAIIIRLLPGEKGNYTPYREKYSGKLNNVRDDLHTWARENMARMEVMEPDMPLDGRQADKWEPLIIVADRAGGSWPERGRKACEYLESLSALETKTPLPILALSDMRDIFVEDKVPFIRSADMVSRMWDVPDSPWADLKLSGHKLADLLRPLSVRPGHDSTRKLRGYRLADVLPAFGTYLPSYPPSESVRKCPIPGQDDMPRTLSDTLRTGQIPERPEVSAGHTVNGRFRTLSDGGYAEPAPSDPLRAALDGPESPPAVRSRGRAGKRQPGTPRARQDGSLTE